MGKGAPSDSEDAILRVTAMDRWGSRSRMQRGGDVSCAVLVARAMNNDEKLVPELLPLVQGAYLSQNNDGIGWRRHSSYVRG